MGVPQNRGKSSNGSSWRKGKKHAYAPDLSKKTTKKGRRKRGYKQGGDLKEARTG